MSRSLGTGFPVTETRQPGAKFFCKLVHDALECEEREILNIGVREPAERYLMSVAFAPELAIGYVVREQALRQPDVAVEGERPYERYEGDTWKSVDVCTVDRNGKCTASLEIKLIADWDPNRNGRCSNDIEKHFNPFARIKDAVSSAKRYNAWILVEDKANSDEELKGRVQKLLCSPGGLDEFDVSDPIRINRVNNVAYKDNQGHSYETLRVIVFSAHLHPTGRILRW
jgi:hypothetical protein